MTDGEKLARCEALTEGIEDHRAAMHEMGQERARLVRELRAAGYGLGQLGKLFGVSKGRVQQLCR